MEYFIIQFGVIAWSWYIELFLLLKFKKDNSVVVRNTSTTTKYVINDHIIRIKNFYNHDHEYETETVPIDELF